MDKEQREAFAREVSRAGSVGYLYLVAGGHRRASPELAKRIERASAGAVKKSDLRPDIFEVSEDASADASAPTVAGVSA